MDLKFGKAPNERDENPPSSSEKKSQTSLLILLLILVLGFAYIYFFTDLIRPQEPVSAPVAAPKVVKKPLPSKQGDKADVADEAADVVGDKNAATADKKQAVDAVKSDKTAKDKQKDKAAASATQPKTDAVKPAVETVAKPETKAKADKQVEPKPAVIPATQKPVTATKPAPAPAPAAKAAPGAGSSGPWTVVAGYYQVEETLAADIVKVKNAGFNPLLTSGPKRPATMHRLIYAEYTSRDQAKDAVQQLGNKGIDSFMSGSGSGFEVVLGSYALMSGAQEEQKRLAAAGITVAIKKAMVPLPTRKLTVGTYTDQKSASNVLNKLKSVGISTAVME